MADVFQQKNVLHCSTFLSGNTTNVQMSRSMEAIMNTACVTVFAQKVFFCTVFVAEQCVGILTLDPFLFPPLSNSLAMDSSRMLACA